MQQPEGEDGSAERLQGGGTMSEGQQQQPYHVVYEEDEDEEEEVDEIGSSDSEDVNRRHFGIMQALPVQGEPDWDSGMCQNSSKKALGAQAAGQP